VAEKWGQENEKLEKQSFLPQNSGLRQMIVTPVTRKRPPRRGDPIAALNSRQRLKQFPHGLSLSRQDEVRRDFRQGFQDKPPQVGAWVRQLELRMVEDKRPKGDEVKVQQTRFIEDFLALSSKNRLQFLEPAQQNKGSFL
jgi:hypothetical protein